MYYSNSKRHHIYNGRPLLINKNNKEKKNNIKYDIYNYITNYNIFIFSFIFSFLFGLYIFDNYVLNYHGLRYNNSNEYILYNNIISAPITITNGNKSINRNMVIDTGATLVLLTKKLLKDLDMIDVLNTDKCHKIYAKTANGIRIGCIITMEKMGILGCAAKDIQALVFINNDKVSDVSLLGMSFLNKFKIVLDRGVMRIYC